MTTRPAPPADLDRAGSGTGWAWLEPGGHTSPPHSRPAAGRRRTLGVEGVRGALPSSAPWPQLGARDGGTRPSEPPGRGTPRPTPPPASTSRRRGPAQPQENRRGQRRTRRRRRARRAKRAWAQRGTSLAVRGHRSLALEDGPVGPSYAAPAAVGGGPSFATCHQCETGIDRAGPFGGPRRHARRLSPAAYAGPVPTHRATCGAGPARAALYETHA